MARHSSLLLYLVNIFQLLYLALCQYYVPPAREYHTSALVGDRLFFIGGSAPNTIYSDFFFLNLSVPFNVNAPSFNNLGLVNWISPNQASAAVGEQVMI